MKQLILLAFIAIVSDAQSQPVPDRRFDLAATYGYFSTPNFARANSGQQFGADFDYHLPNSRITLSAGFLTGKFRYYEDRRSNAPNSILITYPNGVQTNAENSQLHAGFQVKYRLVKTNRFVWQAGAGLGLFNQMLQYPYQDNRQTSYTQSSFTDITFPVSTEAYFRISPRLAAGFKAGAYLEPDFPIVGTNFGPQVRFRF